MQTPRQLSALSAEKSIGERAMERDKSFSGAKGNNSERVGALLDLTKEGDGMLVHVSNILNSVG
jgi:hypothetical protein